MSDVLPSPPWEQINTRWTSGAKITPDEVGELLDMVLLYEVEQARTAQAAAAA